ncbi:MAG: reverse transcriptase domain-containing protein, partial [Planctomycetota bacterium]|nr:reverse transcriptase domain-containing protein [Planctomycetota bacterium]
MLANIFMHYVLDEWIHGDLLKRMPGRIFAVRFADDFVIGFRLKSDADRIMEELTERFAAHKLTIHPEKTKMIKFGRPPSRRAPHSGNGTFDFLGFTHYWARSRRGYWVLKRRTARKRIRRTAIALWQWCRRNR